MEFSWRPDDPPHTTQIDLSLSPAIEATPWQTALARPVKIRLLRLSPKSQRPKTVSIPIGRQKIRTFSYDFAQAAGTGATSASSPVADATGDANSLRESVASPVSAATTRTRIKPPGDIIKMEDRLFYLLQPPLESLVSAGSLGFPFAPFPYQLEGVAFLYPRYAAILADEMGLGKTMQAITSIRLLLNMGEIRNVLLVCPKPLVTNWQREFAMWAPEVPVMAIEGDQTRRHWQWHLPDAPVRLANYELLIRDRDVLTGGDVRFDLVVLDEAQRIKNRSSTTSQVVRSIARRRSWAMTGTPVENSSEDLVGIFEFLSPGYLSDSLSPRRMGRAACDYILRRTKDQVLTDLPPKLYRDADMDLSPAQQATYEMAENEGVVRLSEMGDELDVGHVFELILRLKQICNFDPATGESSKLERLTADLEEVAASGSKAIVFSQWVQTLTQLADRLDRFGTLQYHGRIPSRRRDRVIEQFKEDPGKRVILMSYGAGGVGLNLQFCHYVFLFDRWWNPAVEDQAINRAHRIGVDGPVTVSRFMTVGTIEQRIDQILREKRELFDTIFSHAHQPRNLGLTHEEIFGLFNLKPAARDETRRAA